MKFSLHFSLQSPNREWHQVYAAMLRHVALAERLGFDSMFVAEHHFVRDGWTPSPMIVCGAIAAVTKQVRVGTDIILHPLYHPVEVSEGAAVLDNLSNGRFILGVGLGNRMEEFEVFGVPFKRRASIFEESVQLTKRLLAEQDVTHSGRHFKVHGITVTPRPVQKPNPPIWIAAEKSEKAVRRAARLGDAWIAAPMTPMKVLEKHRVAYEDELKRCGRVDRCFERPLRREGFISDDHTTAWQEAREGLLYLYGEDYFKWAALVDDDGQIISPENAKFEDYIETLKRRFILGGPDDLIREAEEYGRRLGVNHIILRVQLPTLKEEKVQRTIELIGKQVIPYFASKSS